MLSPNRKKSVSKELEISEYSFTHKINLFDTIILGIGSTIGATIFSLIAPATRIAGPAVILAFIIMLNVRVVIRLMVEVLVSLRRLLEKEHYF